MHTLLVNNNNTFVTTNAERIVQRSKVNTIRILIPNEYNGIYMNECVAMLYYRLPISGEVKSRELTPLEELYKDKYVDYQFAADTWLTAEYGDVQIEIRLYKVSMTGELNVNQHVRKITDGIIHISSSKDWGSNIADSLLDTLDQRIIQMMMIQNRQDEMIDEAQFNCASSLAVTDGKIHLVNAFGEQKGEAIDVVMPRVPDVNDDANDGMIEIDDSASENDGHEDNCDCGCNHEFVEIDNDVVDNTPTIEEENGFLEV